MSQKTKNIYTNKISHTTGQDKTRQDISIMHSTIAAKFYFVAVVATLLTGQMSYCDNVPNVASNNNTNATKSNGNSPAQSAVVDAPKNLPDAVEPVKPVVEEKKEAADPAAVVADVSANKFNRGNLLDNQMEIPTTILTGFYIFVAFGLIVIFYISYRSYR